MKSLPEAKATECYADQVCVEPSLAGARLDVAAARYFSEFSRSKLQSWIKLGYILVNNQQVPAKYSIKPNDIIILNAPCEPAVAWQAVPQSFDLVHEDAHLLVVNKPPNLVVHPAAGHQSDTLVNGLLARYPELQALPRAGIVHRLDKDTTGLMVVARTLKAHKALVDALALRSVKRQYQAIVQGVPISGGTLDHPIGRHPRNRLKMAVRSAAAGKPARTHWRVLERYEGFALVGLVLDTGRTHQIRVHLSYAGYPILGDPLYGGRLKLPKGLAPLVAVQLQSFKRQALHALSLGLVHPQTGEWCEWSAPLPDDFVTCLDALKSSSSLYGFQ